MKYLVLFSILGLLISCDEQREIATPVTFRDEIAGTAIEVPVLSFVEELNSEDLFVELIYDGDQYELWKGADLMASGRDVDGLEEGLIEAKKWMDSEGVYPKVVWVVPGSMVFNEMNRVYRLAQASGLIYFYFSVRGDGDGLGKVMPLRGMFMKDCFSPELVFRAEDDLEVFKGVKRWSIQRLQEGGVDIDSVIKGLVKADGGDLGQDRRVRLWIEGEHTCQEVLGFVASLRQRNVDVCHFPDAY